MMELLNVVKSYRTVALSSVMRVYLLSVPRHSNHTEALVALNVRNNYLCMKLRPENSDGFKSTGQNRVE